MAENYQKVVRQVVKAATAVATGGSALMLCALTLVSTVIFLTVATPLMVIFSPVLIPAVITVCLIFTGFLVSGGFGVAGASVLYWMYRNYGLLSREWGLFSLSTRWAATFED
ncbi:Oleosin protein [Dioscorea alata]|uniref:Oleosin protein n=1 Tax=Dioscorea alata TaxID=55571 RepID=A0ACB7UG55_DIOAL|nr:Oleosin protein [Dioscorea alata]